MKISRLLDKLFTISFNNTGPEPNLQLRLSIDPLTSEKVVALYDLQFAQPNLLMFGRGKSWAMAFKRTTFAVYDD